MPTAGSLIVPSRSNTRNAAVGMRPSRNWMRSGQAGSAAPDDAGGLGDARELGRLILDGDAIARHGRGKAALRAQGEPFELHHRRRLRDPAAQLVDRLEPGLLRRHEAEDHHAILGHRAERLEAARALVVVLEEETLEA